MPLIAGMRLGPYEIVAPIGAGGMGEVYRARDQRLNRDVALKVLPHAFAADPDRLRRFQLEAEAAGSLNHPNIVAVYDIGQSDGAVYVVTELLEGDTLRRRLAGAPLPSRKAVEYAVQVARGLAAAHAKGIAHRDIKPENLFLTRDGFVKILDFGLAKMSLPAREDLTSAPTAAIETGAGVVLGTVGYMAPEQVRGAAIDQRCDLFSLGAVLYEMLAGRRAFGGNSSVEVMSAILKDEPSDLPDGVPGPVGGIVRRCLEKNPDERFGSARDLAFALESVTSGSGREKALPPPAQRRIDSARIAVAALLVALPAGAWILAKRTTHAELPRFQQLTFRRGAISSGRFANDGKSILYSAAWDGKPFEFFSTQEDSPESRPLGLANAHIASISRTGEMAVILTPQSYMWNVPTPGTLARAPVSGGAPREIAESVTYADWSPDGSQLAIVRAVPGGEVLEYPPGHKLYESAGWIYMPKVSPKGDAVAFQDCPLGWDGSGQITMVDTSGVKRSLSRRLWFVGGLGWSPDGAEVWFSGAERGSLTSLDAVDRNGHTRALSPLPGLFVLMDVAPDGRVLVMHDEFVASMFFRRAGAAQETDLYWHDNSVVRALSPDGSQILFSEGAGASTTDWISFMRKTDGGAAVRLSEGLASAFSPDGKWAMLNPTGVKAPLIAFPTHAGTPQTLASDAIRHINGRWLPDGKRILFVGSEPGHRQRFYVQDSGRSAPRAISGENLAFDRGDEITISPDGVTVAMATSEQGIQLVPIAGGAPRAVPGSTAGLTPIAWCRDGSLLAARSGEIPEHVVRIDLASGKQSPWKDLAPVDRTALTMVGPIRVTPDCETYAYTAQYDPSTLWVVKGLR